MTESYTEHQPKWSPQSWRGKPIKHQPVYDDEQQLSVILNQINELPPLVFAGEVETLKLKLAQAGRGDLFILQGGDCAERFDDCNAGAITQKLKIMLQMSVVLSYGARRPVLRIGRIAGQYAKPRSQEFETIGEQSLPVYRGDMINSIEASLMARRPDPKRLVTAVQCSALTLNYIRALTRGGFADLHNVESWNLDYFSHPEDRKRYQTMVDNILDVMSFMDSLGTDEDHLGWVDFYVSHEGLLLPYEEAMTRYVPMYDGYYNLGAHMLWIGERTREMDGAHIEYFRGIKNPIGLKIGPQADPRDILQLAKVLNPQSTPGRLTLITRFGSHDVQKALPKFVDAIQEAKVPVVWTVDPMHGNAIKTDKGIKTRSFDDIIFELRQSYLIHQEKGSILGGVHFELTGDDVTECIGGAAGVRVDDLLDNYQSHCDPRLNYAQSLEMAFLIANMLNKAHRKS